MVCHTNHPLSGEIKYSWSSHGRQDEKDSCMQFVHEDETLVDFQDTEQIFYLYNPSSQEDHLYHTPE